MVCYFRQRLTTRPYRPAKVRGGLTRPSPLIHTYIPGFKFSPRTIPVPHIIILDEHVTPDTIRTTWIMVNCVNSTTTVPVCKGQSDSCSEHTYIIMIMFLLGDPPESLKLCSCWQYLPTAASHQTCKPV